MVEKVIGSAERQRISKILESRAIDGDWGEIQAKLDEEDKKQPSKAVVDAIPIFKKHGVKKIIDIGCGGGRHSILFAKEGFDVTALDISGGALKILSGKIKEEKLENIHPLLGDAWKIPAQDRTYDAVVFVRGLDAYMYDTDDRKKAIREMARVLKPGGDALVVLACPREELDELLEAFKEAKLQPLSVALPAEIFVDFWVIKARKEKTEPAKERAEDFNLIGHEQEAREAFMRDFKRTVLMEEFPSLEDANFRPSKDYLQELKEFTEFFRFLVKTKFHSWYTGNYSKETGRITLYRYVNDFPGFDKVLKGEEGLVPRGLTGRSEKQLLEKYKKEQGSSEFQREFYQMYTDYLAGKNVSLQVYRLNAGEECDDDAFMYWTSSDKAVGQVEDMRYRIKIEVKPNEAFRAGGLDEKGDWAGEFNDFCEWRTIGKIPKGAITEIVDLESGKVIYSKKK
jgi:ubiquinone/menaquinone biosynthesis C-methylase UbiE